MLTTEEVEHIVDNYEPAIVAITPIPIPPGVLHGLG